MFSIYYCTILANSHRKQEFHAGKNPMGICTARLVGRIAKTEKKPGLFPQKKICDFLMNCKKPKSSYLPERPLLLNAEKLNEIFFTITTKFCSFLMVYASNASILISRNSTIHFFQPAVNEI